MNVVDGLVSLVDSISNRFVSLVFSVCKVSFEAGVKGASSFTDAKLSTFGAMNDVYNVVHQAVELLCDYVYNVVRQAVELLRDDVYNVVRQAFQLLLDDV